MFVLRFARIERHQGTILEADGLSQFNVVLRVTRIERHQGTTLEADGLSQFNVCIALYTH